MADAASLAVRRELAAALGERLRAVLPWVQFYCASWTEPMLALTDNRGNRGELMLAEWPSLALSRAPHGWWSYCCSYADPGWQEAVLARLVRHFPPLARAGPPGGCISVDVANRPGSGGLV